MLGGVADRIAHVIEPALIDKVDNQFQLVETLEVGNFRLIARLNQGLESGLDERADAAAEHGLFAEQIGFGLFGERGLDDASARDANAFRVRQGQRARPSGRILMDRKQRRRARALDEQLAHAVPGRLRRHHRHVDVRTYADRSEPDVEPMREHQQVARREVRLDFFSIHRGL